MLNTKFDYEYIRDNAVDGWESQWRNLIDGRFIVVGDELVEDADRPIFKLGFTVNEVETAIGFSGLTKREISWRESQPDRFKLVDDEWVEIDGWRAERENRALATALESKLSEIQREKCKIRDAGVTVDGILFDTDSPAQGMYTQTVIKMQMSPGFVVVGWKASPGVYIDLDQALLMSVLKAWETLINNLTVKQASKESAVKAMLTVEEVNAYDASSGWV